MATGRKFGWHSGTLNCLDIKAKGDIYVQDDIVFSDVSAGVLGITGGIDFSTGTPVICIDFGADILGGTSSHLTAFGTAATALALGAITTDRYLNMINITFSGNQNVIGRYNKFTTSGACATGNIYGDYQRAYINHDIQDIYLQMGKIDFSSGTTAISPGQVCATMSEITMSGTGTITVATAGGIYGHLILFPSVAAGPRDIETGPIKGCSVVWQAAKNYSSTTYGFSLNVGDDCYVDYGYHIGTSGEMTSGFYITAGGDGSTTNGFNIAALSLTHTMTNGINIAAACTSAINISAIQTADGGLDETAVFRHGTWSTPLVYGTLTGHTVLKSVSITGAATGVYLMGDLFKLTTTAVSTGTLVGHYNYITVAHTTASTYNYYGRLVMSTDATITNAECMLLTVDVSSGVTLGTTGHLSGLHVAMTIDSGVTDIATGVETCGVYVQTSINKDVTGNTIGIKVEDTGPQYLDYGLQFSNCFVNVTALIHMDLTQGTTTATGILFENNNSHVLDSAFKFKDNADGAVTYLCDFENIAGNENTVYESDSAAATSIHGKIMVKTDDGNKGYINVYSTAN